jgi:hypothetical protein
MLLFYFFVTILHGGNGMIYRPAATIRSIVSTGTFAPLYMSVKVTLNGRRAF